MIHMASKSSERNSIILTSLVSLKLKAIFHDENMLVMSFLCLNARVCKK